ncbi:MAG TPA: phosphotransferase family protein [Candidatus Binataceae bacterium]|nr:phosphotransferase family protein [Candidatus Binataceae bacterium]
MKPDEIERRLTDFIRGQGLYDRVSIADLRKMPGGATREIWSFDCAMEKGDVTTRRAMVLRRDAGAHRIATSRHDEFLVIRAAFAEGVPVPEVFWMCDDAAVLDGPFFLMARVEGETIPRRLLRDEEYAQAREAIPEQLARILAKIHRIDPVKHGLNFLAPPRGDAALEEVERYEQIFRHLALEPHPAFELALRWLKSNAPNSARTTLVHGDYRIGNVIYGPEGVRAIIDWEGAHLGDPLEDVGWICVRAWRFGNDRKPMGGLASREEFFRAYAAAGGPAIDPEAARWWEIFGNLKWGIITIGQARTHIDGGVKSVELASIGRRTAETELELLNLIELHE